MHLYLERLSIHKGLKTLSSVNSKRHTYTVYVSGFGSIREESEGGVPVRDREADTVISPNHAKI